MAEPRGAGGKPKPSIFLLSGILPMPVSVEPRRRWGLAALCWGQILKTCESQLLNYQEYCEPLLKAIVRK